MIAQNPTPFSFLELALAACAPDSELQHAGARWTWTAPGVLSIEPLKDRGLDAAIISTAVHGDEVIPFRLIDTWLRHTEQRELQIERPLLLILANPAAVEAGSRFVKHNMNRLFSRALVSKHVVSEKLATSDDAEHQRAQLLMDVVEDFVSRHPRGLHFDLHSTIKASDQDRFAIVPVDCESRDLSEMHAWLECFGTNAWVQNISPAAAFSSFTARAGYLSVTLELGQVASLDEPIDRFLPLLDELDRLAGGGRASSPQDKTMKGFRVIQEIIRPAGDFKVVLDTFVNFRALAQGTLIARSGEHEWRIEQSGDALLFLNPSVPEGHRVGLVIRQR